MGLEDLIAQARAEFDAKEAVAQDVELGGALVSIAFLPILGQSWSDLTAQNPPRKGSILDGNLGYNVDAVSRAYPRDKITADGEPVTRVELDDEGKTVVVDVWADLMSVLTSPNLRNVATVIWGINQMEPAKKLNELGKASASAVKKKPSSRVNSGSRRAGSRAGSPPK